MLPQWLAATMAPISRKPIFMSNAVVCVQAQYNQVSPAFSLARSHGPETVNATVFVSWKFRRNS